MTVPDGPILKLPEVPWTQPESVFDSGLTRAMRAINDLLGGNDPNSIMGIVGTLDVPGGAGALQKALNGLYSRVNRVAEQVPAKGVHPNRLRSLLQSGAAKEEVEYRRIPELLASHAERPVTREALEQHLQANPAPFPQVIVKGGPPKPRPQMLDVSTIEPVPSQFGYDLPLPGGGMVRAVRYAENQWRVGGDPRVFRTSDEAIVAAREAAHDLLSRTESAARMSEPPATKFAQYQLPGGENYRETLLTLPDAGEEGFQRLLKQRQAVDDEINRLAGGNRFATPPPELVEKYNALQRQIDGMQHAQFQSSHFDEPNILVHVRSNERTLPTGERGRFLEEVQSDWHQKGKKEGYQTGQRITTLPDGYTYKQVDADTEYPRWAVFDETGQQVTAYDNRESATNAALNYLNRARDAGVPDAPFKDSWPDLGLKQQLIEAANDDSLQWLGFTSGQTQAARYDLSKQVRSIVYDPDSQRLVAFPVDGARAVIDQTVPPEKLADTIGKEAADRLLQTPRVVKRFMGDEIGAHQLEGVDLQVGGEGMRKFYDEILPKRLEKIVKPFGGKVERAPVSAGEMNAAEHRAAIDAAWPNDQNVPNAKSEAAWIVRLTPEMKAKIKAAGLPLAAVPFAISHEREQK